MTAAEGSAPCWLCFLDHKVVLLDRESRCPYHGLIRDRVLGIVQLDVGFLRVTGAADDRR